MITLIGSFVLDRRHEFACQHIEAAIPGEGNPLPRALQRLDGVALTERGSHHIIE